MTGALSTLLLRNDTASVLERASVTIDVLDNDQGDGLQIIGYWTASGATLTQDSDQNLVYTADAAQLLALKPGQTLTDTITYRVQDVTGAISEAQVKVTVTGAPNAPDIHGGLRKDVLFGTEGDERIFSWLGGDVVMAEGGSDTVYGGLGKDHIYGGDGADLLFGGLGADWLAGGYGADTLVGGLGPDVFVFEDFWGDDVIVDFDPKTDKIQLPSVYFGSFKDVLADAENDGCGNVVITTPGHDGLLHTITLLGVTEKALRSQDFIFI